ncbi:S-adenosyl-L-methionine-dependent methyltransferase [Polyplosphaeria fusca]|uniref:Trimethylguanosine synthase n=1 Tax=Polyplosphaeria fusca TaxID=682080 RepID=A0A9P4R737_9PLEO|nr:S-adenosyl-L-methionine-dependent methyltransferase [Polyplosphaeria fusca]
MEEPAQESEVHEWLDVDQFPVHLKKYWYQRNTIWHRYHQGVWMTKDAWFGVTPEPIANKIAIHVAEAVPDRQSIIVDAFAGVGGNAIAFAMSGRWDLVFAIEKDPATMKCAKHNAELYGVKDKIFWVYGDSLKEIPRRFQGRDDVVIFASPPWGGPSYSGEEVYDLSQMRPYNLDKLYNSFSPFSKHLIFYLPRNSDIAQISAHGPENHDVHVAHYCIRGASKALCAFYGDYEFGEYDEEEEEEIAKETDITQAKKITQEDTIQVEETATEEADVSQVEETTTEEGIVQVGGTAEESNGQETKE